MEYISLNKNKDQDLEIILENLKHEIIEEDLKKFKNKEHINICENKKRVINNLVDKKDTQNSILLVKTIINNFTQKFNFANNPQEVIQSSLEYNNYLISELIKNKDKIETDQFELCLNILWDNLKSLSINADNFLKENNLIRNNKYCEIYTEMKRKNNEKLSDLKDQNKKENNYSGLVIEINKSILN